MRHSRRLAGPFLLAMAAACGQPTGNDQPPSRITDLPRQLTNAEQAIAQSTPDFAINLLKAVNEGFTDRNVFISPLSASMALGMALNGAAGTTQGEMRAALGLPDRPQAELNAGYQALIALLRGLDPTVDFRIANSVWYEQSFAPFVEPSFLTATRSFFGAEVSALDFGAPSAVSTINAWVNNGTNGKIPRLLESIPDEVIMYLINATYFKGAWRDAFDPKQTKHAPFTTLAGTQVSVPTMTKKKGYRAATIAGTTVVEMPYGGDAFVMTIAMPAQGVSINSFVQGLTRDQWHSYGATVDATFDLYVPKFKITWEGKLNEPLKAMGMKQAFVEGGADFTNLSRTKGTELYVSEVLQKTFVDVNEEGTEAAAATSVGIGITSLPPSFRIDRPFVFAIREKLTGTVLFMGKIVNPGT